MAKAQQTTTASGPANPGPAQKPPEPMRNDGVPEDAACSTCDRYQAGDCTILAGLREAVSQAASDHREPDDVFAEVCGWWEPLPDPVNEQIAEAATASGSPSAAGSEGASV